MNVVVTGAAGFIGMHLAKALLERGDKVLGIDDINDYYDPQLKKNRLSNLLEYKNFIFEKFDIQDQDLLFSNVGKFNPECIIHLAAQAGVRYSIQNPRIYMDVNLTGFFNILELTKNLKCNLIFASSSSVYGSRENTTLTESSNTDNPVSFYAATKKSNELMASAYSKIYDLNIIGIRYFTVYGPWGRPDMAPWIFTSKIINGDEIKVFNNGHMERDFTFINDSVFGTILLLDTMNIQPKGYNVFNIGSNNKINIKNFINLLEENLGIKAKIRYAPMQDGDVISTQADIKKIRDYTGYEPRILVNDGIKIWTNWYRSYQN